MTTTPIHSLNLPVAGKKPWTTLVNDNWEIIDSMFSPLNKITTAGIALNAIDGTLIELLNNVGLEQKNLAGTARTILNLNASDVLVLKDANGNEVLQAPATTSAVNHFEVTNSATGDAVKLAPVGDDTNINLELAGKGTGSIITPTTLLDANGNEWIEHVATGSAVNHIKVTNAATGNTPSISATGEADLGLTMLDSNSNELLEMVAVAAAVNNVKITNAATGNPGLIEAAGETNVGLDTKSKGTGHLRQYTDSNLAQDIDELGNISLPLQPFVHVHLSAEQTATAATTPVGFDVEDYDIGGNYNISTNVFTAPSDGVYQVSCGCEVSEVTLPGSIRIIETNGNHFFTLTVTEVATTFAAAASKAIWLNKDDTLSIQIRNEETAWKIYGDSNNSTFLTITKIA